MALSSPSKAEMNLYFIHSNHLGAPEVVTDKSQQVVWKAHYQPFGEIHQEIHTIATKLRFPGQYFDEETGLHYNYFRDYDPSLGRYIQSDPIGILRDYSDPQMQVAISMGIPLQTFGSGGGLNHLYGYVDQNPLSNIDPFGLAERWEHAVYPDHYFNDRYDQCMSSCMAEANSDVGSIACAGLGAGVAARTGIPVAGEVAGVSCAVTFGELMNQFENYRQCSLSCAEKEQCD